MTPQRLLRTPVGAGAPAGAGEQRVPVAVRREPVQGPRHLLLLLGDGALHQGPGRADQRPQGEALRPSAHAPRPSGVRSSRDRGTYELHAGGGNGKPCPGQSPAGSGSPGPARQGAPPSSPRLSLSGCRPRGPCSPGRERTVWLWRGQGVAGRGRWGPSGACVPSVRGRSPRRRSALCPGRGALDPQKREPPPPPGQPRTALRPRAQAPCSGPAPRRSRRRRA